MKKLTFDSSAACARDSNTFLGVFLFSALILPITCCSQAYSDSKSAAEFMLKICSDAMVDFAKVTAIARDNYWIETTIPEQKYVTSLSMWTVTQGDEKFAVQIWVNMLGVEKKLFPPLKVCGVSFPGKNINRDEFFNFASSSLDLEFARKSQFTESYELKRYRPKRIELSISSNNGTVMMAGMAEMPTSDAPPGVTR
jgi:hypothetical protein